MLPSKFNDELVELKELLAKANNHHNRTGSAALKMAVTEANICFKNSSNDNLQGVGAPSFLGGQFWAEFLGIAMRHGVEFFNFWSVLEGNNQMMNIGYIDRTTLRRQPTWHHFRMMSENFRGTFARSKPNLKNVKTIACKNGDNIVVMVMNQSSSTNQNFTLKFDYTSISGNNPLKINVDAGFDRLYDDQVGNQSTIVLTFDGQGNLLKKCEYSLKGHAEKNIAPTCISITPPVAEITAPKSVVCGDEKLELSVKDQEGFTYQWFKDGKEIEGATNYSYTTSSAGLFTAILSQGQNFYETEPFEVEGAPKAKADITAEGSLNICNTEGVMLVASEGSGFTYTWMVNGNQIPDACDPNCMAAIPGSYQVKVNSVCGEAISDSVKVTGCEAITQSIADDTGDKPVAYIYPNPNNGNFTVEMQTEVEDNETLTLEVINLVGQVIEKIRPMHLNGYIRQWVSLGSNLPGGVYTIRVRTENESYTNRVIITN
jgi:hypothetical protein